jgi:hypothetical protein
MNNTWRRKGTLKRVVSGGGFGCDTPDGSRRVHRSEPENKIIQFRNIQDNKLNITDTTTSKSQSITIHKPTKRVGKAFQLKLEN